MRRRTVLAMVASVGGAAGATVMLAAWLVVPVLWVNWYEMAVPPVTALPDGITIAREEFNCGSGGCWRDYWVRPPEGQSSEELVATLGLESETCAARNWLDRRRVCTGATVLDDEVRVYLLYERIQ